MKILFAPSESKELGGKFPPINKNSFCCPELYDKRLEVLKIYQDFIDNASADELKKIFGIKDEKHINKFKINIFKEKTLKAVERYNGVAYQYLNYQDLSEEQQRFIDENLIIFSNLFGAILASDLIPFYKLKQGESIGSFKPEKFYKEHFQKALDEFIGDELILDLRAGFYEKFYTIKRPYLTMKFLKNGKAISHWAKAYRGLVLKQISRIQPETEKEILDIDFNNMRLIDVKRNKNKTELIYEILED
jgi:hypothetical protein